MQTPSNTHTVTNANVSTDDETRRLRQELAATQQRLEELAAAHAAFVSTFSHDIKNPLTTIMGRVELLKRLANRTVVTPTDIARHLEPLNFAVNRLADLIQSFSAPSEGSSQAETSDVKQNNDA